MPETKLPDPEFFRRVEYALNRLRKALAGLEKLGFKCSVTITITRRSPGEVVSGGPGA